jgi:uncharacterized phage protein (TIGR02220 family)
MAKLRSVNTKFWDDPFITELNPTEKLLFLYLITNSLTNLLGIYEISERKISFDTGMDIKTVRKGLERFGMVRKAFFVENYIILPNWLKNQKLNANMKVAVEKEFNLLPEWLRNKVLSNGSESLGNGYETIRNGLQMVRQVEVEVEVEDKKEDEKEYELKGKNKKIYIDFIKSFNSITGKKIRVPDKKFKGQLNARLDEGFTIDEILKAVENCKNDKYHMENPKYLTPEFITRADKLQKFLNSDENSKERLKFEDVFK